MIRIILLILLAISALAVFLFVWPTQYRYDHIKHSDHTYPVRINRITGTTEMLIPGREWIHQGGPAPAEKPKIALDQREIEKLEGTLSVTSYGWIEAEIYNGTDKELDSVTVLVVVYDNGEKEVLRRTLRLTSTGGGALSSSEFIADCGFSIKNGQTYKWSILSATWE
jgi:hypothetical protein